MFPERSFAAIEPMPTGGQFQQFDRHLVLLHGGDKLAAVLDGHRFVIDGVANEIENEPTIDQGPGEIYEPGETPAIDLDDAFLKGLEQGQAQ